MGKNLEPFFFSVLIRIFMSLAMSISAQLSLILQHVCSARKWKKTLKLELSYSTKKCIFKDKILKQQIQVYFHESRMFGWFFFYLD